MNKVAFSGVLLFLAPAVLLAAGVDYSVTGKYYETCACTVSCPCASNATLPTEGHCDAISLFHIEKGMVGTTAMDGLDIAMVLKTPHGKKVQDTMEAGEVDLLTLYLDEAASPAQRKAMDTLIPALFGTDPIKGSKPPQYAAMKLEVAGDVAKYAIAGGSKLSFEIENIRVGGGKLEGKKGELGDRIELSNSAPFPFVSAITQGISKTFHYDDLGTKWDYKGRNAFFGTVEAKGSYEAKAPAATD